MTYDPEVYKAKRAVQAAASKRYYLKNRERILERQRAYDRAQAQDRREKMINTMGKVAAVSPTSERQLKVSE